MHPLRTPAPAMRFDDELWDLVWERNLTHVERHTIAMAVWRRRAPDSRFEHMVAAELARRWRRHAVYLVGLYGLWTLFWGSIAFATPPPGSEATTLPGVCAAVGVALIACCVVARRYLSGYLQVHGAVGPLVPGLEGAGDRASGGMAEPSEDGSTR